MKTTVRSIIGKIGLILIGLLFSTSLYAQAVVIAEEAVVTEIEQAFEGDAYAPALDATWHETSREAHTAVSGLKFSFVTYQRTV